MTEKIAGVGPSSPTVTNAAGGRQSQVNYRADLLPMRAVLAVSRVLHTGCEKYGPDNWRKIEERSHLNHSLVHLFAYLAGDDQDDHLEHAACRLLMALEQNLDPPEPIRDSS